MARKAKPKIVNYELIPPDSHAGKSMYRMLEELVGSHHPHLAEARIALAWNTSWKPDVDGRVTLGKCKKASDLDRELAPYDFVVLLRRDFWTSFAVTDGQRRALLDHELCHAQVALGEDGEPKVDSAGRTVYRIRKHDIEEFSEIVERHGCYKRDLEQFAAALRRAQQPELPMADAGSQVSRAVVDAAERFIADSCRGGIESVTISTEGKSVTVTKEEAERVGARRRERQGRGDAQAGAGV